MTSKIFIDGKEIEAVLDTGAGLSVITKQFLDKLGRRIDENPTHR